MSKDIKDLSKDELIARLEKAEAKPEVHPNSYASALLMDGHKAPAHVIKNVMHPGFQIMGIVVVVLMIAVFGTLGFFAITT